jgi:signal transduction histidine kinase
VRIDSALSAAAVTGDVSLVESLIANLVDNAIRHNVDGGRVEITTTSADGSHLSISNTGPIVPAHDLERLFEPFQRLGEPRVNAGGGYGLGLAVVQSIASAHGAALTARPRREGGLDVEVAFGATRGVR